MSKNRSQYMRDYQRKWLKNRRDIWIKNNGPCALCGDTKNLQVDHIKPSLKTLESSRIWSRSEKIRLAELKNCQVLCEECHKNKTILENKIRFTGKEFKNKQKHSDKNMAAAFLDIKNGMSEYKASKKHGIPRGTLSSMKFKGYAQKRYTRLTSRVAD